MTMFLMGCGTSTTPGTNASGGNSRASSGRTPSLDELQTTLDEVLTFTLEDRLLNTEDHAAWQILHGALAYQLDFPVQVARDGPVVSSVQHLLDGGYIRGWEVRPGHRFGDGRIGLRAILEEGSKAGQGHADQWFAVLAQCGLQPDQPIIAAGREFTMSDFVQQVQWDLPQNVGREWSWTLIGLTTYLPTDATWQASDNQQWSIKRLVQLEAEQEIESSTCGGSHRLIGLAMALNRHVDQGGQLEGSWKLADEAIRKYVRRARELQNPDGSFSTHYFSRPGMSPDLADTIRTTGHMLEFLTLAMTAEELKQPWVRKATWKLCDVFRKTRDADLECGALYHAAHGLVLYRQQLFGARRYVSRNPRHPNASHMANKLNTIITALGSGIGM